MNSWYPLSVRSALTRASFLVVTLTGMMKPVWSAPAMPVVAVYSKTMNGYVRTARPDNSFNPETYAFAAGGRLDGRYTDKSVDDLKFAQIAGVIAASLKRQDYVATTDAKTANLLIFVYWGTTTGWDDDGEGSGGTLGAGYSAMMNPAQIAPGSNGNSGVDSQRILNDAAADGFDAALDRIAFANEVRDRNNRYNANILGYEKMRNETDFLRPYSVTARDVLSEVEESRYFVVLKAYDFQRLRNHQGKVQLWETRYSIARHGVRFDEQLVDMTRFASQFYGQNLDRLIRRHLREGHVEVGTPVEVRSESAK
jgi:hypothetical protein